MDVNGFIRLETERLILRDHRPEDFPGHHAIMSSSEVMYYLADIMTSTEEQSRENLQESMSGIGDPMRTMYFLRIELKETGEHVGEIGYTVTEFTLVGKLVHLGYFTHRKFWGNGYVTEALRRVLRFAFEENDVFRLTTGCLKENTASERVMRKCGLIKEADMRLKEWLDGAMHDRVEYRLLRDEYALLQGRQPED